MDLDTVESFGLGVKAGYFGNNPPFTILPITAVALQGLIDDYVSKRAAYVSGGLAQKGAFMLAKAALMAALDSLAVETDKVAVGDEAIIILAGFVPTKTAGEGTKPGQCVVTLKRGITGELISNCAIVPGAKHYGCIMTEGAPLPAGASITADGKLILTSLNNPNPPIPNPFPQPEIISAQFDFSDQREKHFMNLIHDATYYFYYYAVNATGVSPLSEVVSMVAW
jgi:hypothetical protein